MIMIFLAMLPLRYAEAFSSSTDGTWVQRTTDNIILPQRHCILSIIHSTYLETCFTALLLIKKQTVLCFVLKRDSLDIGQLTHVLYLLALLESLFQPVDDFCWFSNQNQIISHDIVVLGRQRVEFVFPCSLNCFNSQKKTHMSLMCSKTSVLHKIWKSLTLTPREWNGCNMDPKCERVF